MYILLQETGFQMNYFSFLQRLFEVDVLIVFKLEKIYNFVLLLGSGQSIQSQQISEKDIINVLEDTARNIAASTLSRSDSGQDLEKDARVSYLPYKYSPPSCMSEVFVSYLLYELSPLIFVCIAGRSVCELSPSHLCFHCRQRCL